MLVVLVVGIDAEKQATCPMRKCQEPLGILFAVTLLASQPWKALIPPLTPTSVLQDPADVGSKPRFVVLGAHNPKEDRLC